LLSFFVSCAQQESARNQGLKKDSSLYEPKHTLDSASVRPSSIDVKIENDHYSLKIIQDSLNAGTGASALITLAKGDTTILSKRISSATFDDSLRKNRFKNYILKDIEYSFIRSNRLYFLARFKTTTTPTMDSLRFAIFYRTDKFARLDYW